MLSKPEADLIARAVCEAEAQTSAEIAVCVVKASGEDRGVAAIVSTLVLAAALGVFELAWPEFDRVYALAVAFTLAVASFLTCDLGDLGLRLLPARLLVKDARRAARAVFLDHRLDATPERNAVLLFVSRAERYVEILPDRALAAAVTPERWAAVIAEFRAAAGQAGVVEAICAAVARIGALCAEAFPADAENPDRRANRPISQ